MKSIGNILKQTFRGKRGWVMFGKVLRRLDRRNNGGEVVDRWLREHEVELEGLMRSLDPEIAGEAFEKAALLEEEGKLAIAKAGVELGGAGACPFLYFITRFIRPSVILETGVAAGFSSHAFLSALEENGEGHLWSSDFPYFRLAEPERYIGIVVPEDLKDRWSLFIEGDQENIPKILAESGEIQLFHYDSDKSYQGREWVMKKVESSLTPTSVVIMDDIQDNLFFKDWVTEREIPWVVFSYGGKYVGAAGEIFSSFVPTTETG